MPKVRISGADLDYVESGSGQAAVFVHGSLNDLRSWRQQMETFAERYRVIAYTRRHHFGSEDPGGDRGHSVSTASDDLIDLVEALRLAPVHAIGSSFGAFAILLAANKRPELFRSIVLGEPPVSFLLESYEDTRETWEGFVTEVIRPARRRLAAGETEAGVRHFIDGVGGAGAFDRLPAPAQQHIMANAPSFRIEQHPAERFDKSMAARVTMPVLLLTGELSPPFFHTITDRLQPLLPHTERAEVPNASHGMHGQNAPEYNEIVLKFLAKH